MTPQEWCQVAADVQLYCRGLGKEVYSTENGEDSGEIKSARWGGITLL